MSSNELRMSFAEWIWRMGERSVPYQARGLAVYAVLFKITSNDELAKISGMDMQGIADKTYNRWKRHLVDCGFVIVKSVTVHRITSIEVFPALDGLPVIFTDIKPKSADKFAIQSTVEVTRQNYDRAVEVTRKNYRPIVTSTAEPVKVTADTAKTVEVTAAPVKVTDERPRAPARIESPSGILIRSEDNNTLTPTEIVETAREGARVGETEVGPGVFLNCDTVRHAGFTISLKGLEMQLATASIDATPEERRQIARDAAVGHALQWAAEIDSGSPRSKVLPTNIANFIRGSIVSQRNKSARPQAGSKPGESRADRIARKMKAIAEEEASR